MYRRWEGCGYELLFESLQTCILLVEELLLPKCPDVLLGQMFCNEQTNLHRESVVNLCLQKTLQYEALSAKAQILGGLRSWVLVRTYLYFGRKGKHNTDLK